MLQFPETTDYIHEKYCDRHDNAYILFQYLIINWFIGMVLINFNKLQLLIY